MELCIPSYQHLLQSLKSTVEGLLITQVSNVWNVYGGLKRLHTAVENIFKHGCRVFNNDGEPDCWMFIQGLSWLQPSLAASPTFLSEAEDLLPSLHSDSIDKASVWIYKSLEGHSLSQKLSWLLSDREHLLSCFEKSAFLCQEKYGEAVLICLRAVEQNQPSLLTEINPCLYLSTLSQKLYLKTHRRCSSFPEAQYRMRHSGQLKLAKQQSDDTQLIIKRNALAEQSSPFENVLILLDSDKHENSNNNKNKENINNNLQHDKPSSEDRRETNKSETYDGNANIAPSNLKSGIRLSSSMPDLHHCNIVSGMRERSTTVTSCCKRNPKCSAPLDKECIRPIRFIENSNVAQHKRNNFPKKPDTLSKYKISPSLLKVDYSAVLSSESSSVSEKRNREKLKSSDLSWKHHLKGNWNKKYAKNEVKPNSHVIKMADVKVSGDSSGSSDTLHPEISKSSDENCNVSFKAPFHNTTQPEKSSCIRPSELRLVTSTSDELDSSFSANSDTMKQKRRKMVTSGSAPENCNSWQLRKVYEKKEHLRKSFIEDGGNSVLPMSTGFFPRPVEGQSLLSFLSSGVFSKPSAELDRENAHFSISEAMIAAIEQVKCNQQLKVAEDAGEESDEEINSLKQRIRLRRRQRQEEKGRHLWGASVLSDGKTDTTTTDQSVSPPSSSAGSPSESISTDDVDDLEVDEVKNLSELKNAGLSVSMASLYSEADLSKHPTPRMGTDIALTESIVSAEGVALCLLRQFSEKQLPRASDLQWLVSEQDAPQQLLPLPTSWPISPDEAEDVDMHQATPLRGTMEWAPPRPQVIFTPHETTPRRVLMARQNYRCAGCGMKVAEAYANRYRYCEYLGRYFCTGCHTNQLALIPGKILTKWDFTRYPVSNFSYRLLDQMMCDPLFCIGDLNCDLYRRIKQLERTYLLRFQLYYVKDFVLICRFAEQLQEMFQQEQVYFLTDPDVYSLQDLVQVRNGELIEKLKEMVGRSIKHVTECQLCQARGFFCELCSSKEVIFPWQLDRVTRCSSCGACFHIVCWSSCPCPRCSRISARKSSRGEDELDNC